jgi:hypothetical protein
MGDIVLQNMVIDISRRYSYGVSYTLFDPYYITGACQDNKIYDTILCILLVFLLIQLLGIFLCLILGEGMVYGLALLRLMFLIDTEIDGRKCPFLMK